MYYNLIIEWKQSEVQLTPCGLVMPLDDNDHVQHWLGYSLSGMSLGMRPANERRRYIVTMSLIGWAHT